MIRVLDGLCPLCYRSVAGRAHALLAEDGVVVCEAPILDDRFPRDEQTMEPLLMQLPYRGDSWLFGVACIHLMAVSRRMGEPAFDAFADRWPVGGALLLEPDPTAALREHYRPLGLHEMRSDLTWRVADAGERAYTGYPAEAWRVLTFGDLDRRARDRKVEAWRRWCLWTMGVET